MTLFIVFIGIVFLILMGIAGCSIVWRGSDVCRGSDTFAGLVLAAAFLAMLPVYGLVICAANARPRIVYPYSSMRSSPAKIQYDRCVPNPVRGQNLDGSTMFWRDERIHLSQCWEDS